MQIGFIAIIVIFAIGGIIAYFIFQAITAAQHPAATKTPPAQDSSTTGSRSDGGEAPAAKGPDYASVVKEASGSGYLMALSNSGTATLHYYPVNRPDQEKSVACRSDIDPFEIAAGQYCVWITDVNGGAITARKIVEVKPGTRPDQATKVQPDASP